VPPIPGISHRKAVAALQKAGYVIRREAKHTIMQRGTVIVPIPRHTPIDAVTMGAIVKRAGLTVDEFKALL